MRIGWVSGHPSGISQALVALLLDHWSPAQLEAHLRRVQQHYFSQANALIAGCELHLSGLAHWERPRAGMFLWLRLLGISDSQSLIEKEAVQAKVLMVPGRAFSSLPDTSPYVRASFSTANPDQMDEALRRFAALLRHR